jgi:hypothetical protein
VRLGVEDRGIAVALDERLRDRPFGQPADLVQHFAGGVGVQIAVFALAQCLVNAQNFEQVERLVADVALVVAHYGPPR